MEEQLIKSY